MSLILIILFFLFGWYILISIVRNYIRNKIRRMREMFGGGASGASSRTGGNANRPQRRRSKIIDPSVGEYVDFEEITNASTETSDASGVKYTYESQVEDAEWEEIK